MPLAAYLRNVGAMLLALLFIANFYLPATPAAQRAAVNPPVIRIHSDRKWPEPVVFDTRTAIVSAKPAAWDANVAASPGAGDLQTSRADVSGARDAFAMLPVPDSRHAQSVDQNKRQLKQKTAVRRKHARPQIILAARQGQFAWFGFRTW